MKNSKTRETKNHATQLTITKNVEALRHAGTESNTEHEIEDPAPPPLFISGITNLHRLTAIIVHVANKLHFKINGRHNTDNNKLEFHKIITDILKEKTS
jgi:hypothetical protein